MRSRTAVVFLFFVLCLTATRSSFGQGTDLGTVRGTVTDSSGQLLPVPRSRSQTRLPTLTESPQPMPRVITRYSG